MIVKDGERIRYFKGIRNIFKSFGRWIISAKFLFIILIVGFIFLIGIGLGLFASGYLGTFDNPSQNVIDLLHFLGIDGLRATKSVLEGFKEEGINIPFNYAKGKFSNPKRMYIDVKFEDYKKIEYKREQALGQGLLFASKEDYVPIKIKIDGEEAEAKFRLAGDATGHLEGDKWSFRIKVKGEDTILGMRVFTIRDPNERGYLNEFIFQEAIKREEIMSLRYDFVEVIINGKNKGIFALEEHFDKQLIENNKCREGIILKFDESIWWDSRMFMDDWFTNSSEWYNYLSDDNIWFNSANIETFNNEKILSNPELSKQFKDARDLLESFRHGSLSVEETFDMDLMARFFAINTVFGTLHSSFWHNIRFYYNPITLKLEPVGYDANHYNFYFDSNVLEMYYLPDCIEDENNCSKELNFWWDLFFRDRVFFEKYMQELERVSEESYMDSFFQDLDEVIYNKVNIVHKDTPYYHFPREDYYRIQKGVRNKINPKNSIRVYYKDYLEVGNLGSLPVEIVSINYNQTIIELKKLIQPRVNSEGTINYQRIDLNIDFPELLIVNYKILGKSELLNESVILWEKPVSNLSIYEYTEPLSNIKSGTIIDLVNNSGLIYHTDIQFLGTKEEPIRVISSDNTGKGISVIGAKEVSILRHVIFDGLAEPIVFYKSEANLDNVEFLNIKSEDSLNIVNTRFKINNSLFFNCSFDCFDDDFSKGVIEYTIFNECGNDCIDVSGALVELSHITMDNFKDKGLSGGEGSLVNAKDLDISNGFIGVASKDNSIVNIKEIQLSNVTYGFATYQKKPEYGAGHINATINMDSFDSDYIIEKGSEVVINNNKLEGKEKNVYDRLLGEYNEI